VRADGQFHGDALDSERRVNRRKRYAGRRCTVMMIEISVAERDLLNKILDSYLSELRHAIAATKRDTSLLHAEENLVNELKRKLSELA
jgi:hypothetical protein